MNKLNFTMWTTMMMNFGENNFAQIKNQKLNCTLTISKIVEFKYMK